MVRTLGWGCWAWTAPGHSKTETRHVRMRWGMMLFSVEILQRRPRVGASLQNRWRQKVTLGACAIAPGQVLLLRGRHAVFFDNTASFSRDVDEFQPVAKSFAAPDHGLHLHLHWRIRKTHFEKHPGTDGDGAGNIGAHAAVTQVVAATKRRTAAPRSFDRNFQAHVNPVQR